MILKKLYINNMFAYYGEIEIDLEPKNNKNIILIGARNGRGKTSFLRIIRILIHGLKNNGDFTKEYEKLTPNEYALGKGNKWEGIFSKKAGISEASIKGILEFNDKKMIINRKFYKSSGTFKETLQVKFDQEEQEPPQEFLDNILPKNFAQFFFFNGENIGNLINSQNLNIKDSLEVLLNIKTYEKLIANIKEVQKKYRKETAETPTINNIKRLEDEEEFLTRSVTRNKEEIDIIEKEQERLEIEIHERTKNLEDIVKIDIEPFKIEKVDIEEELKSLKDYISKKIKSIDFLVLMTETISENYLLKLEDNKTNYELDEQLKVFKRTLNTFIPKIQNNVFDNEIGNIPPEFNLTADITDFYQDRIREESNKVWIEFKNKKTKESDKQIIYYNEEDKKRLKNIFKEKAIMYQNFTDLKYKEKRLKQIENKIENFIETKYENTYFNNEYKKEKQELENEKSVNDKKIGELTNDTKAKIKKIKLLESNIKKLEKELNLSQPILNSIDLSEKLINFFKEFTSDLLSKKINNLEREFNKYLFELSYDTKWIKKSKINAKFEITLFNYLEDEISIGSLSEGQKQILATALIQALGSVSEVKSFICIDTPLARIDSENREQIITKYYPKASKQVIILSTNSEIDPSKKEYRLIKDFISKEYTIILDEYKSSFEDGYFNEISRS